MKKQTAVEFSEELIKVILYYLDDAELQRIQEVFNQAKELDKEQELKKWIEAWSLGYDSGFNNCINLFNNKQQIT
jgi:hypothetical protein